MGYLLSYPKTVPCQWCLPGAGCLVTAAHPKDNLRAVLCAQHNEQYDTVHRGGVSLLWSGLDQIRNQMAGLPASALCIWIKFYVYDYRFLSCWGSIKFFPISPFFPITSWQDLATGDQSEASIRVTWSLSNNQRLVLVETVCPRHMGLKNYLKTISFSSLIVKIAAITTK